jgi:uncharacterized protein YfaP (DUF2135 family)
MILKIILILGLALDMGIANAQRPDTKPFLGQGTTKPVITVDHPSSGWTVSQMIDVSGSIDDVTIDPLTVSVNGDRFFVRNFGGKFQRKFPLLPGKNSIIVQGSNRAGTTQVAKTIFAGIPPAPLFIVLSSDMDGIYTDLHIYEPHPESQNPFEESKEKNHHVYWAYTASPSGGNLYLNNQRGYFDEPGYGPYLYTHRSPPKGIYRVDANYWPSGDKPQVVAYMNITIFGGTPYEQKRSMKTPLIMRGETATLGYIRFDGYKNSHIYIPSVDPKPNNNQIWPKWVIDAPVRILGKNQSI